MREKNGLTPDQIKIFSETVDRLVQRRPQTIVPTIVSAQYTSGEVNINLTEPRQIVKRPLFDENTIQATLEYPPAQEGEFILRKRETFSATVPPTEMSYNVETKIYDKDDRLLEDPEPEHITLFKQGKFTEAFDLRKKMKREEESLGIYTVTPDKYERIMGILTSLETTIDGKNYTD